MVDAHERRYLKWMKRQIAYDRAKSYDDLFEILFEKEFVWIVPNDDNRIEDGMEIRHSYFKEHGVLSRGCSVLEVILAMSQRLAFNAGGEADDWAWTLIENLELHKMSGHIGQRRADQIEETLEKFIWRTYEADGSGGMFPLAWPKYDQRRIELWYQMCAYIDEIVEL